MDRLLGFFLQFHFSTSGIDPDHPFSTVPSAIVGAVLSKTGLQNLRRQPSQHQPARGLAEQLHVKRWFRRPWLPSLRASGRGVHIAHGLPHWGHPQLKITDRLRWPKTSLALWRERKPRRTILAVCWTPTLNWLKQSRRFSPMLSPLRSLLDVAELASQSHSLLVLLVFCFGGLFVFGFLLFFFVCCLFVVALLVMAVWTCIGPCQFNFWGFFQLPTSML